MEGGVSDRPPRHGRGGRAGWWWRSGFVSTFTGW